jgi:hypothetical protein
MLDPAYAMKQITIVREELTAVLGQCSSSSKRIAKALTALQSLERELVAMAAEQPTALRRGPKVAKTVEGYRIEKYPSQPPVLAEYRSTEAEPFRCPMDIVLATAEGLQALKLCRFTDLHEAVQKSLGKRVADYQVRTALRWMKHAELIRHERAMFSPSTTGSLKPLVSKAWKQLEAKG